MLANRFCAPTWAFLSQVRNTTGYLKTIRTADAIAMGLYPSRGLDLHGFEIKTHRGDWLRELKNPEKSEEIAQFCDFWWIVAPKDVVILNELPSSWGLMNPFGKTLKVKKDAEKLKPVQLDKPFLAAILRRAEEVSTPRAALEKSRKLGLEDGLKQRQSLIDYAEQRLKDAKAKMQEFKEKSGVDLDFAYDGGEIGEAVRAVRNGNHLMIKRQLENLQDTAERITSSIKNELDDLKKDDKR